MNRVPHGREDYSPFSVLVCPTRNGLCPVILVSETVDVLSFKKNVLLIFVVGDVMLLIVHYKILDPWVMGWLLLTTRTLKGRMVGWPIYAPPWTSRYVGEVTET